MNLDFSVTQHEYEAGTVFDDGICYGVYIEVGSDACEEWFAEQGLEGNGYTILALVDSLCRLKLVGERAQLEMEAEADNTWVYSRDKALIDRFILLFCEVTGDEAGVRRLIANASREMLE